MGGEIFSSTAAAGIIDSVAEVIVWEPRRLERRAAVRRRGKQIAEAPHLLFPSCAAELWLQLIPLSVLQLLKRRQDVRLVDALAVLDVPLAEPTS